MSSIFDECEIKYHNIPSESKVFIYAYLVFIDYDKQKKTIRLQINITTITNIWIVVVLLFLR
jgi:hypothetical protein